MGNLLSDNVISMIQTVGFPIVAFLLVFGFLFKIMSWQRADRVKWESEMKDMQGMSLQVIRQSAEAMTKLCVSLENAISKAQDNQHQIMDELRRK